MKNLRMPAFMLALSMLLSACGNNANNTSTEESKPAIETSEGTNANGGLMVLGISSDPTSVNPLYANDRVSLTISNVLFDHPYKVENGEIVYDGLAESMEASEDFLTYTLKLKDGIKWHDGEPVTADDFIFTYDSILDDKQNAKGQNYLKTEDGAIEYTKIDDKTIEFKLPEVDTTFVEGISDISPIAKHIYEGEQDIAKSSKNQEPVGNGPFKFKEQKTGELYQVERFDDYYGDVAKLDGIAYRVVPDANAREVALESGEISASYIDAEDAQKYEQSGDYNIVSIEEGLLTNVFMRVNSEKLKDVKVRKAISYAIDKEKLIQGAYGNESYAEPAYSPFSSNTTFYTDDVEKYEYDVEKAKELLKEAGAEDLKLNLMYGSGNPQTEKECLLIQEMLKQAGITVELVPLESSTFIEKLLDKDNDELDLASNGYVMGTNPYSYSAIFKSDSQENFSTYSNPEVDELFEKAKREIDDSKREEIYKEIQQILVDDAAQYSIANVKKLVAVRKDFTNLEEANPAPVHMFDYFNKIEKK